MIPQRLRGGRNEQREHEKKYRGYLQGELQSAALYEGLADAERDPDRKAVFQEMAQAELRHATRWAQRLGLSKEHVRPRSTLQTRAIAWLGRALGTHRVLPIALRTETDGRRTYRLDPEARDLAREEHHHARMVRNLSESQENKGVVPEEEWHSAASSSGTLRAAVLGVNDGLVSNFSLVMGIAGGSGEPAIIVLAGIAGLVAGAFSMAAGEYVSMRAQRDVYERQLEMEAEELQVDPDEEFRELVLIYRSKGLTEEEAERVAGRIIKNTGIVLDTMAREELGLDPGDLGSPWGAAVSSFLAFAAGASVPVAPYLTGNGPAVLLTSAGLSGGALLLVGSLLAAQSNRPVWWGALRMLLAGGLAAAVTYGIGSAVGTVIV